MREPSVSVFQIYCDKQFFCSVRAYFFFYLTPVILVFPLSVLAVPPDISGGYSGSLSGSETCTPPNPDPSFTTTLTFTITQNAGNFSATGSFIDDGNETGSFTLNGTVDDNGNVSGSVNVMPDAGFNQSGTFTGSFSNGQLSLTNITVVDDSPGTCTSVAGGTFSRSAGGDLVVDPEITPSNVLTTPFLLNTQVKTITTDLNTRIGDVLRGIAMGPRQTTTGLMWQGSASGLNAGNQPVNYGFWSSFSYSDFDNDFVSTAYDGQQFGFLVGFDISPWENFVLGVALGYESADIDTDFNRGNQEIDGYTVAPYVGLLLGNNWSIDASAGYSRVDSDQYRTDPGTDARITSSPSADRWFGSMNLNGFTNWNNWLLSGHVGVLHARNVQEHFSESNGDVTPDFTTRFSQWNVGGEASYSFDEFEPFTRLSYERDFSMTEISLITGPQPENDNDNYLVGAGVRYFGKNGITGNLEWYKRIDRDNYNEDTFSILLRKDF